MRYLQFTLSRMMLPILTVCIGVASPVVGNAQTAVAVQKVQIADGIYQFITGADGYVPNGNSVVIVNDHDVLVFDTFAAPLLHAQCWPKFARSPNKPIRYVVNSHHHPDHWSGNEVYAGIP